MTEAADRVSDNNKKIVSEVTNRLNTRSLRLQRFAYVIVLAIIALILSVPILLYLAELLTSNEITNLDKQISQLIKEQGDLTAQLVPKLYQTAQNANSFDKGLSDRGLSQVQLADYEKNPNDYTNFGAARVEYFSSKDPIVKFVSERIGKVVRKVGAAHGDIVVIKFDVSLTGMEDEYDTHYIWAINLKDINAVVDAIKDMEITEIDDSSALVRSVSQRLEKRYQIASLVALRDEAATVLRNDRPNQAVDLKQTDTKDLRQANTGGIGSAGYYLLQLNVNKFGILTLATVLIGILSGLYKYNMRLATYYMARVDALELHPTQNKVGFVRLADALTPRIDFPKAGAISLVSKADTPGGEHNDA